MYRKNDWEFRLTSALGLILLVLVATEAYMMPLTHDELSTIGFSQQSFLDIITYKDPIPNNHILNTLLLKLNIYLFGDHLITNRLPNILAFILYFVLSVKLSRLLAKDVFFRIGLIVLMTMQAFLFDFFSVARGYGLSLGLLAVSLYYLVQYIKFNNQKDAIFSLIFGAIGVIANFTLLNYYLPLMAILGFYILYQNKTSKQHSFPVKQIGGLIGISLILGLICYVPFKKMMATNQFQYWGNKSFYTDTVVELIYSMRSGVDYLPWNKSEYALLVTSIFSIILISGVYFYFKSKVKDHTFLVFASLFILMIIYNNLQHYVAGVPFLNARTALFFIPICAIFIVLAIQMIAHSKEWLGIIMICSFTILNIQHFFRANNTRTNFEWYQDGETHDVLREIHNYIEQHKLKKPVKVDCNWIFHPSMTYHIEKKYKGTIELLPYHKETNSNSSATFYYAESFETEALKDNFMALKDYNWKTKFILKRIDGR